MVILITSCTLNMISLIGACLSVLSRILLSYLQSSGKSRNVSRLNSIEQELCVLSLFPVYVATAEVYLA